MGLKEMWCWRGQLKSTDKKEAIGAGKRKISVFFPGKAFPQRFLFLFMFLRNKVYSANV